MGHEVYANNMAISAKASDGKSICAFPDVCFTPPQTPATPPGVPIPYPNTGMASDTTDGSKTVKLKGKEVMLKNKSYFKKSTGDEAGCAPKKGIVTSKIQGKVYFIAWSMDVKVEGENVVRHLDMTTHNHASPGANSTPIVHAEKMAPKRRAQCKDVLKKYPVEPYDRQKKKRSGVYKGRQSHHVLQNAFFQMPRGKTIVDICPSYTEGGAPCIPLRDGMNPRTEHGKATKAQRNAAREYRRSKKNPTYKDARNDSKNQLMAKPKPGLSHTQAECILFEVDKYFAKVCGGSPDKQLRAPGRRGKWKPAKKVSGSARASAV